MDELEYRAELQISGSNEECLRVYRLLKQLEELTGAKASLGWALVRPVRAQQGNRPS